MSLLDDAKGIISGFRGDKVYLFSEVNGVITLNNQPVKGAKVIRRAEWNEKVHIDEAITAEDGSFHFPVLDSGKRIVISEFIGLQKIDVEYKGKSWLIWRMVKSSPGINEELRDRNYPDGMPIQFTCDLSSKDRLLALMAGVLRTKCIFPNKIGKELPADDEEESQ